MSTSKSWTTYFKVIGIKPGKVQHPKTGVIDLSNENLPVSKVKELYDAECPYLEVTPDGKKELYTEDKKEAK